MKHQSLVTLFFSFLLGGLSQTGQAALTPEIDRLINMEVEELLNLKIQSASGVEETVRDAPAAMVVITAEQIKQRGYTGLWELFSDLLGFDTIHTGQVSQVITYQRGYRTPWTQRTLFLVNGKPDHQTA